MSLLVLKVLGWEQSGALDVLITVWTGKQFLKSSESWSPSIIFFCPSKSSSTSSSHPLETKLEHLEAPLCKLVLELSDDDVWHSFQCVMLRVFFCPIFQCGTKVSSNTVADCGCKCLAQETTLHVLLWTKRPFGHAVLTRARPNHMQQGDKPFCLIHPPVGLARKWCEQWEHSETNWVGQANPCFQMTWLDCNSMRRFKHAQVSLECHSWPHTVRVPIGSEANPCFFLSKFNLSQKGHLCY